LAALRGQQAFVGWCKNVPIVILHCPAGADKFRHRLLPGFTIGHRLGRSLQVFRQRRPLLQNLIEQSGDLP
jgi:hypothetical protein